MAKNQTAAKRTRNGAGTWAGVGITGDARGMTIGSLKRVRREVLFPTEPSTIGEKKIDRAVEEVISRRK